MEKLCGMCRPACFVIQKEKGVLSVGIQTDVKHIFPTLYACAPSRPAALLLSGCSFVVFQAVNLRSTCNYFHYLSLSRRVPRIRQPYADTDTAIRRFTQHYFARSNHCVPFFTLSVSIAILHASYEAESREPNHRKFPISKELESIGPTAMPCAFAPHTG